MLLFPENKDLIYDVNFSEKDSIFHVGNIYPENSSLWKRFGLYDLKRN